VYDFSAFELSGRSCDKFKRGTCGGFADGGGGAPACFVELAEEGWLAFDELLAALGFDFSVGLERAVAADVLDGFAFAQ